MSSLPKSKGSKIAVKFTEDLVGDVTGTEDAVGGYKLGAVLSIGKPATAGSTRGTGYEPEKAFDDNPDTQWEPSYRNLTWLKVDLEEVKDVMGVTLRRAGGGYATRYDIHGSLDDSTWDLIYQQSDSDTSLSDYRYLDIEFDELASYRYFRITVVSRSGNYPGFSIVNYREPAPIGNEDAFTITAQEEEHDGRIDPLIEAPLINVEYEVESVEERPVDEVSDNYNTDEAWNDGTHDDTEPRSGRLELGEAV